MARPSPSRYVVLAHVTVHVRDDGVGQRGLVGQYPFLGYPQVLAWSPRVDQHLDQTRQGFPGDRGESRSNERIDPTLEREQPDQGVMKHLEQARAFTSMVP